MNEDCVFQSVLQDLWFVILLRLKPYTAVGSFFETWCIPSRRIYRWLSAIVTFFSGRSHRCWNIRANWKCWYWWSLYLFWAILKFLSSSSRTVVITSFDAILFSVTSSAMSSIVHRLISEVFSNFTRHVVYHLYGYRQGVVWDDFPIFRVTNLIKPSNMSYLTAWTGIIRLRHRHCREWVIDRYRGAVF